MTDRLLRRVLPGDPPRPWRVAIPAADGVGSEFVTFTGIEVRLVDGCLVFCDHRGSVIHALAAGAWTEFAP